MNNIDIRAVADHERRAVIDTIRAAFLNGAINDEHFAAGLESWDESDALAAWDGDRCVGHVAAFRFDSTVPGGARVPTAGVTRVGVLPTHTRQGLLTRLMHRLLVDARASGQTIATLHASETAIYRRFGFGLGTDAAAVFITTRDAKPWRTPAAPGTMRLLAHGEVLDVTPGLYQQVARQRVGTVSRPAWWWKRVMKPAAEKATDQRGPGSFVAIHTDVDGVDDGYVFYEAGWEEAFAANPTASGKVHDLWGASPAVELALWRYLLDIDLVTTWTCEPRPVDDPVRRAMHDSRAYETRAHFDDQWVRLLDVDVALTSRTYGPALDPVTLGVQDPLFSDNTRTWEISCHGAQVTSRPAEAEVEIAALSAAYLGAVSWRDLSAAGGLALDDDLLTRLDTLFASRPTPFCGTGY